MELKLKEKETKLNETLKQNEERDRSWQQEKDEMLKEVTKLKAETTKMVKILAMEYEEDNLNENKKRSLTQEVYSLQLVLEMRTGEVKTLREQLARARHELEEGDIVKEKLKKATARIEDLEEQLESKDRFER